MLWRAAYPAQGRERSWGQRKPIGQTHRCARQAAELDAVHESVVGQMGPNLLPQTSRLCLQPGQAQFGALQMHLRPRAGVPGWMALLRIATPSWRKQLKPQRVERGSTFELSTCSACSASGVFQIRVALSPGLEASKPWGVAESKEGLSQCDGRKLGCG